MSLQDMLNINISPELGLATALIAGLLIGAEREQKSIGDVNSVAGIRTFTLVSLLGALGQQLGQIVLAALALVIGVGTILTHLRRQPEDPGLTSEIALLVTYGIGALCMTAPQLGLAVAIVVAVVLAFRTHIHALVRETISATELRNVLLFAAAALVILPLVPNETIASAFNPFVLWRLAVVVMGVTLAAHVVQRILGPRWGFAVAGFASGFVSSSALIAAMGSEAKADASRMPQTLAAATASTVSTYVQLAVLVGTASPALLRAMVVPLGSGFIASIIYASFFAWRGAQVVPVTEQTVVSLKFRGAIVFAVLVSIITFLAGAAERSLGAVGVVVGAAVAAFADTHAAAASIASVFASNGLDERTAAIAVLVALTTNACTKLFLAFTSGPKRYAWFIAAGLAFSLLGQWGGFLLSGV
jgi:uncharacterized membrane protein (DUF4010 family)